MKQRKMLNMHGYAHSQSQTQGIVTKPCNPSTQEAQGSLPFHPLCEDSSLRATGGKSVLSGLSHVSHFRQHRCCLWLAEVCVSTRDWETIEERQAPLKEGAAFDVTGLGPRET